MISTRLVFPLNQSKSRGLFPLEALSLSNVGTRLRVHFDLNNNSFVIWCFSGAFFAVCEKKIPFHHLLKWEEVYRGFRIQTEQQKCDESIVFSRNLVFFNDRAVAFGISVNDYEVSELKNWFKNENNWHWLLNCRILSENPFFGSWKRGKPFANRE